jgi:cell wall assembly regulator SMI1
MWRAETVKEHRRSRGTRLTRLGQRATDAVQENGLVRLSDELRGLEQRWRERGAPVDALLRPGVDAGVVAQTLLTIAEPHPDVVTWYGWYDGSHYDPEPILAPTGRNFTQLAEAVRTREVLLFIEADMLGSGDRDDPEMAFQPSWLPVADTRDADGNAIAVDLVTGAVFRYDNGEGTGVYLQRSLFIADDLASLVHLWCDELDRGTYVWDSATYQWQYDRADQPADLRDRHIIH